MFEKLLQSVMLDYVVRWKKLLQCNDVCNSLVIASKGLKHGVGKDIYVAQNVIEVAIVSTSSNTSLGATRSCIGLNKRTLRRGFYQRQVLDVK